jgi:hypothetical protein
MFCTIPSQYWSLPPREKQNVSCYWAVRDRSQNPNNEPQYKKANLKVKVTWRPSYWPIPRHTKWLILMAKISDHICDGLTQPRLDRIVLAVH